MEHKSRLGTTKERSDDVLLVSLLSPSLWSSYSKSSGYIHSGPHHFYLDGLSTSINHLKPTNAISTSTVQNSK